MRARRRTSTTALLSDGRRAIGGKRLRVRSSRTCVFQAPHVPLHNPPEWMLPEDYPKPRSNREEFEAMLVAMDTAIGNPSRIGRPREHLRPGAGRQRHGRLFGSRRAEPAPWKVDDVRRWSERSLLRDRTERRPRDDHCTGTRSRPDGHAHRAGFDRDSTLGPRPIPFHWFRFSEIRRRRCAITWSATSRTEHKAGARATPRSIAWLESPDRLVKGRWFQRDTDVEQTTALLRSLVRSGASSRHYARTTDNAEHIAAVTAFYEAYLKR